MIKVWFYWHMLKIAGTKYRTNGDVLKIGTTKIYSKDQKETANILGTDNEERSLEEFQVHRVYWKQKK